MKFALVVPALNEQDAIAGTLRRVLASRDKVIAQTAVDEMVVVFVNDGSTDGTQEIVDHPEFREVVKVRFEKNRGYGAAIKAGWRATDADLVGFIDGDGTCDSDFCVNLVNALQKESADVVLAARLQPDSEMPFIRKLGNMIFAKLLGIVSGNRLTDSASGFRIVRRSSLKLMTPLPDGLHFTPAMSAICMLDPRLNIVEVHGMKYKEREGRSKLSVVKDGVRFLSTIMFAACCYAPIKTMLGFAALTAMTFALFALLPIGDPWFATTVGVPVIAALLGGGAVVHQLNYLLIGPRRQAGAAERLLQSVLRHRLLLIAGGAMCGLGGLMVMLHDTVAQEFGRWGMSTAIWLCTLGALAGVGGVILRVVWAVGEKQHALIQDEYQFDAKLAVAGSVKRESDEQMESDDEEQKQAMSA